MCGSVCLVKIWEGWGGDAVFMHEELGEFLASLQFRGLRVRAEDEEAVIAEYIRNPGNQRLFGSDHGQIDEIPLCELDEFLEIRFRYRHVLRQFADPAVARGAKHLFHIRAFEYLPYQRMFPSAAADDQHLHCLLLAYRCGFR